MLFTDSKAAQLQFWCGHCCHHHCIMQRVVSKVEHFYLTLAACKSALLQHTGQLPVLESVCEGKWVNLYKLWRLVHDCHASQPSSHIPWGAIASALLGCPAWRQDAASQVQSLYRTKLMDFDTSLMKHAAAFRAIPQPAPSPQSPPHAVYVPTSGPESRAASHEHSPGPAAASPVPLSNGAPQQVPAGLPLHMHVTRGRNKRARSSSSELVSQQQPASQPVSGLSPSEELPSAQPALHLQKPLHPQQQQQQQQLQQLPGTLPNGAVPMVMQQAEYQPLQANPRPSASPAGLSARAPSQQQQHQQSPQPPQQSPQQLQMRPMPQDRAAQPAPPRLTSPRPLAGGHVDGMTPEEIIAAATAAAAASGYCAPEQSSQFAKGLASLAASSMQVSMVYCCQMLSCTVATFTATGSVCNALNTKPSSIQTMSNYVHILSATSSQDISQYPAVN